MNREIADKFECPFCGGIFSRREEGCGGRCGLHGTCGLVCCPRCGYSFVSESRAVRFFKERLQRKKGKERSHES